MLASYHICSAYTLLVRKLGGSAQCVRCGYTRDARPLWFSSHPSLFIISRLLDGTLDGTVTRRRHPFFCECKTSTQHLYDVWPPHTPLLASQRHIPHSIHRRRRITLSSPTHPCPRSPPALPLPPRTTHLTKLVHRAPINSSRKRMSYHPYILTCSRFIPYVSKPSP